MDVRSKAELFQAIRDTLEIRAASWNQKTCSYSLSWAQAFQRSGHSPDLEAMVGLAIVSGCHRQGIDNLGNVAKAA
ncbi:MAG: hypothetical protein WAN43_01230 [Rhodomicrobium sp.]|jgi:hypothetical protein